MDNQYLEKSKKIRDGREIIIRDALPEDAEEILAYMNQAGRESNNLSFGAEGFPITPEQEREFLQGMSEKQTSCMLVGIVDSRIVTDVGLSGMQRKRFSHRGSIGISVLREYWGQGIGTIMIQELIDRAKAAGLKQLELEVKSDNIHAIHLYEKMGFNKTGVYPNFFQIDGICYDADLMVLIL